MLDEHMKMKIRGHLGGFYGLIFWAWYEAQMIRMMYLCNENVDTAKDE